MTPSLESWASRPYQPEVSRMPRGIAVVIFNPREEVLLGLEAQRDQFRKRFKWNIQTETINLFVDHDVNTATVRLFHEELGTSMRKFSKYQESDHELIEWYTEMGIKFTFYCSSYLYEGKMENAARLFHPQNRKEIITHQWFPVTDLPESLETGARLVIHEYRGLLWHK